MASARKKIPTARTRYDAIIIGAGCGGTTAAALLAKNGYDVLLLEQSSLIGGCCSTAKIRGYNFDLGASIIEDADVIQIIIIHSLADAIPNPEWVPVH